MLILNLKFTDILLVFELQAWTAQPNEQTDGQAQCNASRGL